MNENGELEWLKQRAPETQPSTTPQLEFQQQPSQFRKQTSQFQQKPTQSQQQLSQFQVFPHFVIQLSDGTGFVTVPVTDAPGFVFREPLKLINTNVCFEKNGSLIDGIIEGFYNSEEECRIRIQSLTNSSENKQEETTKKCECEVYLKRIIKLERNTKVFSEKFEHLERKMKIIEESINESDRYETIVSCLYAFFLF